MTRQDGKINMDAMKKIIEIPEGQKITTDFLVNSIKDLAIGIENINIHLIKEEARVRRKEMKIAFGKR